MKTSAQIALATLALVALLVVSGWYGIVAWLWVIMMTPLLALGGVVFLIFASRRELIAGNITQGEIKRTGRKGLIFGIVAALLIIVPILIQAFLG